jgi:DNA repair photolyase
MTNRRELPVLGQTPPAAAAGEETVVDSLFDESGHLVAVDTALPAREPSALRLNIQDELVEAGDTLPELAQVLAEEEELQERFRRAKPTGEGDDALGHYQVIPLSRMLGGKLEEFKVYTAPEKHLVSDGAAAPRGWYKSKHEPKGVRPRPCYSEALLTTPYTGYCNVGCKFCYIDHGTRGYKATGLPVANPNYPEEMRDRLKKMNVCGAVYMSSFTEVFQKIEERHSIVERLTNYVVAEGLPIFYLTRKLPPQWAVDALQQNPYSYMQFSINTSDNNQYRRMSPGSYNIPDILSCIRGLREQNIYTSIQCNPVLPGVTSLEDILKLVRMLADVGNNHIIVKFVEQVTGNRRILFDRLRNSKIDGVDKLDELMCQVIGSMYTIREDLRRSWLERILAETRSVGMTMSLCYEYYDDGGAGANMAPWFTTSDQCHGPAVPVHYRPSPGAPFQALQGCYRKGCLYCEEHGTRACGSETLLQAKALEYGDLRNTALWNTLREHTDADWELPDSCPRPEDARRLRGRNPHMLTDAELWGLDPLPPLTRRAVGLRTGKGAKDAIDQMLLAESQPAEVSPPEMGGLGG